MQIFINDQQHNMNDGTTLAQLAENLKLDARKVAMEINLTIIPRALYEQTTLMDGDRVEIVQFIGGG